MIIMNLIICEKIVQISANVIELFYEVIGQFAGRIVSFVLDLLMVCPPLDLKG